MTDPAEDLSDQPGGLEELAAWLGGLWEGVVPALQGIGATITQAFVEGMTGAGESLYAIGNWTGFLTGAAVLLLVPTKIVSWIGRLGKLPKALEVFVDLWKAGEKALEPVLDGLKTMVDGAMELGRTAFGALANLPGIRVILELIERLARAFDELFEGLGERLLLKKAGKETAEEAAERAAREAAEEAAERGARESAEDAAKKKRLREDEEDDTDEKKAARKAARDAWAKLAAETNDHLKSESELKKVIGNLPSRVSGVRVAYKLQELTDAWEIRAEAGAGSDKVKRDEGSGWIARDGNTVRYGSKSAVKDDERELEEMFDEAQRDLAEAVNPGMEGADQRLSSELAESAAASDGDLMYPELDAKMVAVGAIALNAEGMAEVEVDASIKPNNAEDVRKVTARQEDPNFPEYLDLGTLQFWEKHVDKPWAEAFEEAEESFRWSSLSGLRVPGVDAIESRVKTAFESWNQSKREWRDRIEEHVGSDADLRFDLMKPTLEGAVKQLASKPDFEQVKIDKDSAELRMPGGVNDTLKAAVDGASYDGESGVVAFLLEIVERESSGGVARGDFVGSGSMGWHHENPTLANRAYVKERFRKAAKGGGGYHEWIPCATLGDIVGSAKDTATAERAARWIRTAHAVRSETWCIIFQPPKAPTAEAEMRYAELLGEHGSPAAVAPHMTVGGDFTLAGHSGALYVDVDTGEEVRRVQQVTGQGDFHKKLEAMVDLNKEPATMEVPLLQFVDKELWAGDVEFLPQDLRPDSITPLIPSTYVGSSKKAWANRLKPFANEAAKARDQVREDIAVGFE